MLWNLGRTAMPSHPFPEPFMASSRRRVYSPTSEFCNICGVACISLSDRLSLSLLPTGHMSIRVRGYFKEFPVATVEILPVSRRETVVDAIVRSLVQYIAENRLQAGDRLPSERTLVEMLGASRLPIREALSVLKGLGIVESRHGRGFFVKQLDPAAVFGMLSPLLRIQSAMDQRHLLEARLALEMEIAALAAEHRHDKNLDVLNAELDGMRASICDRSEYVAHDKAFHRELARAAGNPVFCVFMASITDLLAELHDRFRDELSFRQEAISEHETIVQAIREASPRTARQAMQCHLANAMARL